MRVLQACRVSGHLVLAVCRDVDELLIGFLAYFRRSKIARPETFGCGSIPLAVGAMVSYAPCLVKTRHVILRRCARSEEQRIRDKKQYPRNLAEAARNSFQTSHRDANAKPTVLCHLLRLRHKSNLLSASLL